MIERHLERLFCFGEAPGANKPIAPGNMVGSFFLVDRVGRRLLLLLGMITMCITMLVGTSDTKLKLGEKHHLFFWGGGLFHVDQKSFLKMVHCEFFFLFKWSLAVWDGGPSLLIPVLGHRIKSAGKAKKHAFAEGHFFPLSSLMLEIEKQTCAFSFSASTCIAWRFSSEACYSYRRKRRSSSINSMYKFKWRSHPHPTPFHPRNAVGTCTTGTWSHNYKGEVPKLFCGDTSEETKYIDGHGMSIGKSTDLPFL